MDTAGDSTPYGGQEQDSQPDQELLSNLEAMSTGQKERQQPEDPANLNQMQGNTPLNSSTIRSASISVNDWIAV